MHPVVGDVGMPEPLIILAVVRCSSGARSCLTSPEGAAGRFGSSRPSSLQSTPRRTISRLRRRENLGTGQLIRLRHPCEATTPTEDSGLFLPPPVASARFAHL